VLKHIYLQLKLTVGFKIPILLTCHPLQGHILNISDHQPGNLQSKVRLDEHCSIFYWCHI